MTENKILIYAGTTEGRRLAEFLVKREVSVHVCVATEYGESLLPEGSNITTTHERMDENQMIEFINEYHPSYDSGCDSPLCDRSDRKPAKCM